MRVTAILCAVILASLFAGACSRPRLVEFPIDGEVLSHRLNAHDGVRAKSCPLKIGEQWQELVGASPYEQIVIDVSPDGHARFRSFVRAATWSGIPTTTPQCEKLIRRAVSRWRYRPFESYGIPVTGRIVEYVELYRPEEYLPQHVAFPVPTSPSAVAIELRRTACFGSCPNYRLRVDGDGKVVFEGYSDTLYSGTKVFTIPRPKVAQLVDAFRRADFYSLKDEYGGAIDAPHCILSIAIDGRLKRVTEFDGERDGMPSAVHHLEDEIDEIAAGLIRPKKPWP